MFSMCVPGNKRNMQGLTVNTESINHSNVVSVTDTTGAEAVIAIAVNHKCAEMSLVNRYLNTPVGCVKQRTPKTTTRPYDSEQSASSTTAKDSLQLEPEVHKEASSRSNRTAARPGAPAMATTEE